MKTNKIETEESKLKHFKLLYDVNALPYSLAPDMMVKLADSGYIFYDSEKGQRPKLFQVGEAGDVTLPVMIDVKGEEVPLENIKKEWEDKEFWRKELYKCKQSPLYYFTNYLSITPKPTQKEVNEFLESIGMGAKTDSSALDSEEVQKIREEFSTNITLKHLQDLKPVRDKVDEEYTQETETLLEEAAKFFDLSGKHQEPIKEKIILALLKTPTKGCPEELKYYVEAKSGRWDKALMRATDIDVLVRLWKTLS
jgi:hypothetical protein